MRIDIAHSADCPNWEQARSNVREALERLGWQRIELTDTVVTTEEDARRVGMRGSPTILVDGDDSFDTGLGPALACRLYRGPAGVTGTPSTEDLVRVLGGDGLSPSRIGPA